MRQSDDETRLDPSLLLQVYSIGFFPMASSRQGEIELYSPDPRAIIPLNGFHVSRSLRQTLRKNIFDIRLNSAFEQVMRNCAAREETWISEEIIRLYVALHHQGYAHSVEAWHDNKLVGGLYGVSLRGAFFGESMFSLLTDASKVCLVYLVERLKQRGFTLLDTQYITEHLRRFGAIEIPRREYLHMLSEALQHDVTFV